MLVYKNRFIYSSFSQKMEKEVGKRRASEETVPDDVNGIESPAMKRQRETEIFELNDDVMSWLSMENYKTDAMSELLKLVDNSGKPTTSSCLPKVKFSDNPYSSALVIQSSSSFVTINGNEETCGSSFSDSESSVMASVDTGGILSANVKVEDRLVEIRGLLEKECDGAWGEGEGKARGKWTVGWEWDEMQLARFLGEEWLF